MTRQHTHPALIAAMQPPAPLVLAAATRTRLHGTTRTRTATTPRTPHAGTRPTPQPADARYTITWEHTGAPTVRAVLRFCGVWCSSHDTADQAHTAQVEHNRRRTNTED
jgi:hypothetical protein